MGGVGAGGGYTSLQFSKVRAEDKMWESSAIRWNLKPQD